MAGPYDSLVLGSWPDSKDLQYSCLAGPSDLCHARGLHSWLRMRDSRGRAECILGDILGFWPLCYAPLRLWNLGSGPSSGCVSGARIPPLCICKMGMANIHLLGGYEGLRGQGPYSTSPQPGALSSLVHTCPTHPVTCLLLWVGVLYPARC
jgi:hypothetical protein